MKLEIYPACLDCSFLALKECTATRSKRDAFGEYNTEYINVMYCDHLPICKHIEGQKMITPDMFAGGGDDH